jgi:4-amino-4-deoxychorismate lyase
MLVINGQAANMLPVQDRGLQYGDGLFETIAYRHGQLEFYAAHIERLHQGCSRLHIPFIDWSLLDSEVAEMTASLNSDAVIKIIITRGQGGRGYRFDDNMQPTRIISSHPMPNYPEAWGNGIQIRFCTHPLSINTALAGLKHLNRLDQVMARSEWQDTTITEGLMSDHHGRLIEGTMTNLFIVKAGKLFTPSLKETGIAGIMRATVLRLALSLSLECIETSLSKSELLDADEVFLTNSLIDIWPVVSIQGHSQHWPHGPITQSLQAALAVMNR